MIRQKRGRLVVLLAIQGTISSLLLIYILRLIPLAQIFETVARASPHLVFFTFVLMCLERYVLAFQLKGITDGQGMGLSSVQIFRINIITGFYELFLPGPAASGVIRWYKLAQQSKMKIPALVAVGFNRIVQSVVLILMGSLCWSLDPRAKDAALTGIFFFFLLIGLLTLYALFMNNQLFAYVLNRVERALALVIPVSFQKPIAKLMNALGNFHQLPLKTKLEIFGLTLSANILAIVGWLLLAQALMLPVTLVTITWIRSCIGILVMIPISFAGLGVREGSLMILLPPYGIALDEALAFSVLLLFMRICWGMIGGLLEAWDFFSHR